MRVKMRFLLAVPFLFFLSFCCPISRSPLLSIVCLSACSLSSQHAIDALARFASLRPATPAEIEAEKAIALAADQMNLEAAVKKQREMVELREDLVLARVPDQSTTLSSRSHPQLRPLSHHPRLLRFPHPHPLLTLSRSSRTRTDHRRDEDELRFAEQQALAQAEEEQEEEDAEDDSDQDAVEEEEEEVPERDGGPRAADEEIAAEEEAFNDDDDMKEERPRRAGGGRVCR